MSRFVHILATIETDPTRFHGERPSPPRLPGQTESEQVLSHLAADLSRMFPEVQRCHVAMAGALYDQTQILRPGYPAHAALDALLAGDGAAGEGRRQRVAATADETGALPDERLQPDFSAAPGPLLVLPLTAKGEAGLVQSLEEAMEHRFMEQGQLSAHSAKSLEAHFGIAVNHARFMTVTDLLAMLRLQLEHFGFLPLWELLYAALTESGDDRTVHGRQNQCFEWREGAVHCGFETFDGWAAGAGDSETSSLGQAYGDWTREYRQYLTTLTAHRVPLVQHLGNPRGETLDAGFFVEASANVPGPDAAELTEHSCSDVGTVAVTVIRDGRQENHYPLTASGLNDLHAAIRARGLGPAGFSYPGRILFDAEHRRLLPDTAPAGRD